MRVGLGIAECRRAAFCLAGDAAATPRNGPARIWHGARSPVTASTAATAATPRWILQSVPGTSHPG